MPYGGVYVCTALLWLRVVDGVKLSAYDWAGALIALCGMLIIVAGWGAPERPDFVIARGYFDHYTCMVVAQLRKFPASQHAM